MEFRKVIPNNVRLMDFSQNCLTAFKASKEALRLDVH